MNAEQIAAPRAADLADAPVAGPVRPARQLAGRSGLRRPPHLPLQGQGGRPAGPPRLRPRGDRRASRSSRPTRGTVLHASWLGIYGNCVIIDHGMGVASLYGHLSSIDVSGRQGREGPDARPQRHDRPGRRRSSALHDAGRRAAGESGRMVGSALDRGPGRAEAEAAGATPP